MDAGKAGYRSLRRFARQGAPGRLTAGRLPAIVAAKTASERWNPCRICSAPSHESRCQEDQENYRWFGETVLIVRGRLISGGWQCDKCNAPLNRGHKAWLMTAFPRSMNAGMGDYDFAHEKRYFNMKRAEVAVYGAEWPGVAGASG